VTEPLSEEQPVRCACGRLLADPRSKARGLGPVCFRRLHPRRARTRLRRPAAGPGFPGQDELPLVEQPTLY
jgi:hypothetical protein